MEDKGEHEGEGVNEIWWGFRMMVIGLLSLLILVVVSHHHPQTNSQIFILEFGKF